QPGSGGVSYSPYSAIIANNREQVERLYDLDLRSEEAQGIINGLRDYADQHKIEPRHLDNLLNYIRNYQLERARCEDRSLSYEEAQAIEEDFEQFLRENPELETEARAFEKTVDDFIADPEIDAEIRAAADEYFAKGAISSDTEKRITETAREY